jgi:acetyltransferase
MQKMIEYCRQRGTREVVGQVLRDNAAMLKLTTRLGFTARDLPDSQLREVRLRLA